MGQRGPQRQLRKRVSQAAVLPEVAARLNCHRICALCMQVVTAIRMTLYHVGQLESVATGGASAPGRQCGAVARMWLSEAHLDALCTVLREANNKVRHNMKQLTKVRCSAHVWRGKDHCVPSIRFVAHTCSCHM
jgi:hypothetical protein